ncbi:MAG: cupin domain-containing protein [Sedimentisphaerales bacterium]|nr:cupin domain-containing protein [Sedimentisphaerales bacterium]
MPTVKDVIVRKPTEEEALTCKSWDTWGCPASEFLWDYTQTETCLILEGQVTVTDRPEGTDSVSFGPGDLVIFPVGLKCIWKVTNPVRKHYDFS